MPPPPSPGASPPGKRWVILRRMGCTDPGLPQGTGFCLPIGSSAPDLTELFVSPLVDSGSGALVRNPTVLAADPSGLLLLSGDSDGENPAARAPYFLCDAVSNTVRQLPHLPGYGHTAGTAGLIVSHNDPAPECGADDAGQIDGYMVAALAVFDYTAILHCFSPQTGGVWIHKTLNAPLLVRSDLRTDSVLSLDGKIWWIDLSQGIFSCNPADVSQGLDFVPFPNLRRSSYLFGPRVRWDPPTHRSVHLSDGKLRYAVLTARTRTRPPKIKLWTLVHLNRRHSGWTLDFEVSFEDIWADKMYKKTGLLKTLPVVALVHPSDPNVVYFAQQKRLFGFNLQMKMLTECAANLVGITEASSGGLLAWELPPSLKVSAGPSPWTSAFDGLASSFCDAFDRALMDMEFHQFTRTAVAYLNKDIAKQESRLKVSNLLSICYFDDGVDVDGKPKQYAHINFNADAGSESVLVFAELSKTVDGSDPWALSSCKKLTKNSHGGLRDEDVDMEQSQGTRKRKRSLYCFACMGELKHPKGGFAGGHSGVESY